MKPLIIHFKMFKSGSVKNLELKNFIIFCGIILFIIVIMFIVYINNCPYYATYCDKENNLICLKDEVLDKCCDRFDFECLIELENYQEAKRRAENDVEKMEITI